MEFDHPNFFHFEKLTNDKAANWRYVLNVLYQKNVRWCFGRGRQCGFSVPLRRGYFDELWITKVPRLFGETAVPFLKDRRLIDLDLMLDRVDQYGLDVVMRYKNKHVSDFR